MALTIQVDGACLLKVDTGTSHALEDLGYSMNGVEITEQVFSLDVHGDQNGGEAGVPIDVQYLGEIHIIRATLTKYDEAVLNKLRARLYGGTAGAVVAAGYLWGQDSKLYRFVTASTLRPRDYGGVLFREAFEINKGTKHSQAVIVAHCYPVSSTSKLWIPYV